MNVVFKNVFFCLDLKYCFFEDSNDVMCIWCVVYGVYSIWCV